MEQRYVMDVRSMQQPKPDAQATYVGFERHVNSNEG